MIVSGWSPGQGVTGFIANADNPFSPVTDPYPAGNAANPPPGFTPKDEGYAGLIQGRPAAGGATLNVYCIDINTDTTVNIGYVLGTWEESGVPNVGYVARILNEYYPHDPSLPALATDAQKAAAVQAAIWFFSDRYALSTDDPLYHAVVAIVNHIKAEGPLPAPTPPTLTLTPSSLSAPGKGSVIGPFTVHTNQPSATVTATGGTMYSNAAGTARLGDGTMADVHDGQEIWVRSTGPPFTAVLQAKATAEVPSGNVWLYDGNTPGWNDAQRLILAETATLTTQVQATAEFQVGSLVVRKTIAGQAAGTQGRVVIHVLCTDFVPRRPFIIPAGAHAGTRSITYRDIDTGTRCVVIETSNGRTSTTTVVVRGNGQLVTIPAGGTRTVEIRDIYHFVPGSLIVRKTITGPAAGQQGEIRTHTVCNGTALSPDFVIDAGASKGDYAKQYDGISVPASCTVTETADGHTSTVSVIVEGGRQTISIGPGRVVPVDISDTYGLVPGQLEVTKTIAGPAAGKQGPITIHTVCDGTALSPDFVITAGAAAGVYSHTYSGLPGGATCVVTETADGATSAISVVLAGNPHTTTVPAGGAGAATITDTYTAIPGSLFVTKTIAGPSAGQQGPVTIHAVCNGTALSPDFVIAAGTGASTVSHSFDGIPAGSVCTVTETTDGATATVTPTLSSDGQTVTVPAATVVPVSLTDVYEDTPGSLKVTKTIAGPAAHQHGPIAIEVACGGLFDSAFLIPAHTVGSVSRYFDGLPAGSRCTVTETEDGHTNTVAVVASARGKTVTIPANGTASVHITDRFRIKPVPPRPPLVTG